MKEVTPFKDSSLEKKQQVEQMFDNISKRYDILNRVLSLRVDTLWRNKVVKYVKNDAPNLTLDLATGTADLAIELSKATEGKIIGADLSAGMLEVGKKKVAKKKLSDKITLQQEDAENMSFEDNTFDVITIAFGVRNFGNLEAGLSDMYRVLKPGGKLYILEFSKPERFPVKQVYQFYFTKLLPTIGKLVSKDKDAYTYLPDSVNSFPYGEKMNGILQNCKYKNVSNEVLSFGIASLYKAEK